MWWIILQTVEDDIECTVNYS